MECCNSQNITDYIHSNFNLKPISHPRCQVRSPPWFDLRVFYVRVSDFEVNDSTPDQLSLNYIPLGPHTILKVNGKRSSAFSDCVSSQLRRDRMDKKSEEATFVNTDNIEMTGSVRFEVLDGDDVLLSGVLELCSGDGLNGEEANGRSKKWIIKCQSHMSACGGMVKGEESVGTELVSPIVDVYVAGSFYGRPIILTKTLELLCSPSKSKKLPLGSIPEYESTDAKKAIPPDALQICQYGDHKAESGVDYGHNSGHRLGDYMEGEDGELSWFNAGVRVGVGISLGVCVGVGLGVGLLVRTSRNFKRRLF